MWLLFASADYRNKALKRLELGTIEYIFVTNGTNLSYHKAVFVTNGTTILPDKYVYVTNGTEMQHTALAFVTNGTAIPPMERIRVMNFDVLQAMGFPG